MMQSRWGQKEFVHELYLLCLAPNIRYSGDNLCVASHPFRYSKVTLLEVTLLIDWALARQRRLFASQPSPIFYGVIYLIT
jgi:hypothetical protein